MGEEKVQTQEFVIEVWLIAYIPTLSVTTQRPHYVGQEPGFSSSYKAEWLLGSPNRLH